MSMSRTRPAATTLAALDRYCAAYRALFPDVRSFEYFTALHVALLAASSRKSLPQLANMVRVNPQALHHFVANGVWSVEGLRAQRLSLLSAALNRSTFVLRLEDTGTPKKGETTDYTTQQYMPNLQQEADGIVTIDAYGILGSTTFPLLSRVYKPQERLKPGDTYKSKTQLAVELIQEVRKYGFHPRLVVVDSSYGQSGRFIVALHQLGLRYVLLIRSLSDAWMLSGQKMRPTRWRPFDRDAASMSAQLHYIRELIFGTRRLVRCYEISSEGVEASPASTWRIVTNQPGPIDRVVGGIAGLRLAAEYQDKQARDRLGWGDFRLTDIDAIERWWEIVLSAYTWVSLHS